MGRFAVILYPDFSLQEITCLTSALSVWFEEKIEFIASENKEYCSEEGLRVMPTKTIADTNITDYECIILPGTINPLPALYDDNLIDFLKSGINTDVIFAAISSSPLLLAKAGILKGKKFTSGFFMQMAEVFPFVEKENFIHKGIVCDGNVVTGIGMFFREFAETVLRKFDYDIGSNFMRDKPEDYTEEELTFYWSEEDFSEFLEELKAYKQ
ncbi:MAG: DJ-1/PfpI family protein [Oscillospiraceae bacterium]|nr:DJ-1/PfpI family protein [Oscillospiraceae bacterium]